MREAASGFSYEEEKRGVSQVNDDRPKRPGMR